MKDLVIQPATEGKGRSFQATLLSYVTANALWPGGQTGSEVNRPVWMMVAGSENELRPFVANLQLGKKAELTSSMRWSSRSKASDRFEILKSAGFQTAWQRTPEGSVATLYLPDLFRLDPGMVDPKGVAFCVLPAVEDLNGIRVDDSTREFADRAVQKDNREHFDHMLRLAPLFIAYLDRRTRCPLIPDPRFYFQVLDAALEIGIASWSKTLYYNRLGNHGFQEYNTAAVGLAPGIVFNSTHPTLEQFLAEQVQVYFQRVRG